MSLGHQVRRQRRCAGSVIDIFDVTADELIECKLRVTSATLGEAAGQLAGLVFTSVGLSEPTRCPPLRSARGAGGPMVLPRQGWGNLKDPGSAKPRPFSASRLARLSIRRNDSLGKPQAWADDVLRGVAKHRQLAPAGSSIGSKNR
jgi:hypothetical protein